MDKVNLRNLAKDNLTNLDMEKKAEIEKEIIQNLINSELWKQATTVGITVSAGFEWDTEALIKEGWKERKTVVVPKCVPDVRRLDFYKLDHFEQLEASYFNLREPNPSETVKVDKQEIDLLVVPGLVFDERGYRVGFGGGYYDRFLTDYPNRTVSLLYSGQLVAEVPKESFDVPVEYLITENGFVK
ncbi:5-formyltetrahydrofolate cyclo-ligase [Oceanobacillus alkalisoli]|nr:5-formyltetrahydrofolate cyclo-ligase [Oceanobacillus alkalisoli]MCF3941962.1 5-formyltetrahydrofolate cyclo-ligase [Oceanobacillus alkalisoli]